MKKIVMLAASVRLSVGVLVGCGSSAALKDGSYQGEAQGHNGVIKLTVTVADGVISGVTVDENTETPEIFPNAEEKVIPSVVGKKSADDAEVASGATVSSNALKEAINKALEQAK